MRRDEIGEIKIGIDLLLSSVAVDYNNQTCIQQSEKYLDYIFDCLCDNKTILSPKEAGFPLAGQY